MDSKRELLDSLREIRLLSNEAMASQMRSMQSLEDLRKAIWDLEKRKAAGVGKSE